MTVRVRGIYATALTRLLREAGHEVVQASGPIEDRFDGEFADERAAVTVTTTDDQQGVGVIGDHDAAAAVTDRLTELGRDTLHWSDPTPEGAIYAGTVTDTLGSGAVVDLGDGEGFLPYSSSDERVETGDTLRVQVVEASAPWTDGRPVLDTTVAVRGSLLSLVRGETASTPGTGGPAMLDLSPRSPGTAGASRGSRRARTRVSTRGCGTRRRQRPMRRPSMIARRGRRARGLRADPLRRGTFDGVAVVRPREPVRPRRGPPRGDVDDAGPPPREGRGPRGQRRCGLRRSACDDPDTGETDFPFAVTTRQFGPQVGGSLSLGHGKPDGRLITLGDGEVQSVDHDGR